MAGKATVNLGQRTVGRLGLLWNRITPTRGSKSVNNTLAHLAFKGDVKVLVERDNLYVQDGQQKTPLLSSKAYAKCLYKAGVLEFEIPNETVSKEIKGVLDTLSDRGLKRTKRILEDKSITAEIKCENFKLFPRSLKRLMRAFLECPERYIVDVLTMLHQTYYKSYNYRLVDAVAGKVNPKQLHNYYLLINNLTAETVDSLKPEQLDELAKIEEDEKLEKMLKLFQGINRTVLIVDHIATNLAHASLDRLFQLVKIVERIRNNALVNELLDRLPRDKLLQIVYSRKLSSSTFDFVARRIDLFIDDLTRDTLEHLKYLIKTGEETRRISSLKTVVASPKIAISILLELLKNNFSEGQGIGKQIGWLNEGEHKKVICSESEQSYHSTGGQAFGWTTYEWEKEVEIEPPSGPIYEKYAYTYPIRQIAAKNLKKRLDSLAPEIRSRVEKALAETVFEEIK